MLNRSLNEQAAAYLSAMKERRPQDMQAFIHPAVLAASADPGDFSDLMRRIWEEADSNPDKAAMLAIDLDLSSASVSREKQTCAARITTHVPFIVEGKLLGRIEGPTYAISQDGGNQWYFVEGREEALQLLPETERALLSKLPVVKPAFRPVIGRKRTYQTEESMKRFLFILMLSIIKPEAVADRDILAFGQKLLKELS